MFNYINSIKCKEINPIGICVVCFLNMWTFNVSLGFFAFLIPIIFQSWGFVISGNRFLWNNEASYISKVYQILASNYYISITLYSFYVVKFKSGEIINPEFLFFICTRYYDIYGVIQNPDQTNYVFGAISFFLYLRKS